MFLPFGKVIHSRAYRAMGDGRIERLRRGVWVQFARRADHKAARQCLNDWAKNRVVPGVGA